MTRATLYLSLVLAAAVPAAAGVVYEIEVKDHESSPPKTETMEAAVEGRNLKMEIASRGEGRQGEMIYRGDRREMVVVDHDARSFFVMDEEAMRALAAQLDQAMAQMEKALEGVPEGQRAQIEAMMKGQMPQKQVARTPTEVRKTGERAEHGGYSCVMYDVLRAGKTIRQHCVTAWGNLKGSAEVAGVFEDMAGFFREMLDAMPQMAGANAAGGGMDDNPFEHMKELGGFPVYTRELGADGSLEGESTLRSARRQTIDPDAFDPPSGYKRQEMFGQR